MTSVDVGQVAPDSALSAFATALRRHDIYYRYSDDSRAYARGAAEYDELIDMALGLPRGEVLALVELRAKRAFCWPTMGAAADSAVRSYLKAFEAQMEKVDR